MNALQHGIYIFFVRLHPFLDERHDLFFLYGEDCYFRSDDSDGLTSLGVETGSIMTEVLSLSKGFYDRAVDLYTHTAFADKKYVLWKIMLPVNIPSKTVDPFCKVLNTLCSLFVSQKEEQAMSLDNFVYDRMIVLV